MEIKDLTDLQLAEIQGNAYQQFMQIQGNLIAINQEIQARKPKVEPVKETPTEEKK